TGKPSEREFPNIRGLNMEEPPERRRSGTPPQGGTRSRVGPALVEHSFIRRAVRGCYRRLVPGTATVPGLERSAWGPSAKRSSGPNREETFIFGQLGEAQPVNKSLFLIR